MTNKELIKGLSNALTRAIITAEMQSRFIEGRITKQQLDEWLDIIKKELPVDTEKLIVEIDRL